jgi:hypothetical protein
VGGLVKLPGLSQVLDGLDPGELNPVRCAVCAHLDEPGKVEVVIQGTGVCVNHSMLIDRHNGRLAPAVDELLKRTRASS